MVLCTVRYCGVQQQSDPLRLAESVYGQARGIPNDVTFIVGEAPQPEFERSTRNIVGTRVLPARVSGINTYFLRRA